MRSHQVDMTAAVRSEVGKSAARRMRKAGKIPAVMYGRGKKNLTLAVEEAEFSRALPESAWYSTLLKLDIDGAPSGDSKPSVMIAEVQKDPVRSRVLSIDFRRISLQETVMAQVPVIHVGLSPGVKVGGILEHLIHEVPVECLPTDIPDHLEADISELAIGDSLRVKDLTLPEGVKATIGEDEVVLVIAPPVKLEEPEPVEEEGALISEAEEPEVIGESKPEE